MTALRCASKGASRHAVRNLRPPSPGQPAEEFDEVGAQIAGALDHFKVPEPEKQELLAVIVSKKTEVVSS